MLTRTYLSLVPLLLAGLLSACGSVSPLPEGSPGGPPPPAGTSCVSSYQRPDWNQLIGSLDQAQARWKAADLHTYTYTNTAQSFSRPFVTRVAVENDVVVRVQDEETGELLDPKYALTIDQLFAGLRESIARAKADSQSCFVLDVTYDASLGFPTVINSADLTEGLQDAFGSLYISQLERPTP